MINNYKKYIIISLLLAIILIGGGFTYYTYAKYISSISSDTEVSLARWSIKINNQDVSSGSQFSNVITPVFAGNANIAPNVIAPTAEGYFDIDLDVTNTDVSLRYEITTSDNEDSAVDDLIISGYSIDGGQRQSVVNNGQNSGLMVSGTIAHDSLDKEVEIRVYLMWNDDPSNGATMDNFDDADAASVSTNKAKVNVNVRVIQLPTTNSNNNNSGNNSSGNDSGNNSGNDSGNGNG